MEAFMELWSPSTFMTLVAGLGKIFICSADDFTSVAVPCWENRKALNKKLKSTTIRFIDPIFTTR